MIAAAEAARFSSITDPVSAIPSFFFSSTFPAPLPLTPTFFAFILSAHSRLAFLPLSAASALAFFAASSFSFRVKAPNGAAVADFEVSEGRWEGACGARLEWRIGERGFVVGLIVDILVRGLGFEMLVGTMLDVFD